MNVAQWVTAICLGAGVATVTIGIAYASLWIWYGKRPEVV